MRSSSFVLVVFGGLGLVAGPAQVRSGPLVANTGTSWDTLVFRDDFDSPGPAPPDPAKWIVNHPPNWWWKQGRTHFPNPDPWLPNGEFPRVDKGALVIEHHLYNRFDLGDPNQWFLGGEVHTVREFQPNQSYRFEARVKVDPHTPNGLVTSFFLYGYDGSNSDEIDFEFLSNRMNEFDPNRDPVLTNPWNESRQKPEQVMPDALDLTQWNTFRIYWYPDKPRVDWTWVIQPGTLDEREVLLRTETDPYYIPDEAMALYFNFWAPTADWGKAYDEGLRPVNDPMLNEISAYEIDYVEVRVPEPQTVVLLVVGAVSVCRRRRRTRS